MSFRGFGSRRGRGGPPSRSAPPASTAPRDGSEEAQPSQPSQPAQPSQASSRTSQPSSRGPEWHLERRREEQYWERLRIHARDALNNRNDVELQSLIRRTNDEMQLSERPSRERVVTLTAQFLDFANMRLEGRHAVLYLARAHWNYQSALTTYADEVFEDGDSSLSEIETEVEEGEVDHDSVDEDNVDDGNDGDGLAQMRRRNRGVDRTAAKKNVRDNSKLVIRIRVGQGKPDAVYDYSHNHAEVDWSKPAQIRLLNRWRAQVLRRALGVGRPPRIRFHELEKQFLVDAHAEFKRSELAAGRQPKWQSFNLNDLTEAFNRRFEGQVLPGSSVPRPRRTLAALRTERSRLQEITSMAGIAPKDQKPPSKKARKDGDGGEKK